MNVHSANRLPKQEKEHIVKKSSMTYVSGYHIKSRLASNVIYVTGRLCKLRYL